jgi:hypothetical protein
MVTTILAFLAGVIAAVLVEEMLRWFYRRASREVANTRLGRIVLRRRGVRRLNVEALGDRWETRIGGLAFPWVVAAYGPFRNENIESYFHPEEPSYPPEVDRALEELSMDVAARKSKGEDVPFDSKDFKLLRFHVGSRTEGLEEPRLVLHFGPTTFFRMLATDQRLDVPITEPLRESWRPDRLRGLGDDN